MNDEGVLLGRLIIFNDSHFKISPKEIAAIKSIKTLMDAKEDFTKAYSVNSVSMAELEAKERNMKKEWDKVQQNILRVAHEDSPQFHFDVFLTRDGIILLRDVTPEKWNTSYRESNTPDDFTRNIPMHRVFKSAMNFVKYLFHKNYHHEEEHDTLLPVSNLHPYRQNRNFDRIFKHQIDAFLDPLMLWRRRGIKHVKLDPIGMLCYANSFVYACRNNGLISPEFASRQLEYLKIQESETSHRSRHTRSLMSSLESQKSWFVIISAVLAFSVAIIKIFEFGRRLYSDGTTQLLTSDKWWLAIIILITIGFLGFGCYWVSFYHARKKEFHPGSTLSWINRIKRKHYFQDSDLEKGELSARLQAYIKKQDKLFKDRNKVKSRRIFINAVIALMGLIGLGAVIGAILYIL